MSSTGNSWGSEAPSTISKTSSRYVVYRGKVLVGQDLHVSTGVYISVRKQYVSPPPLWKWYFFPLLGHIVFWLPSWPFCLNSSLFCNYFTLLLPLFSFLSPFFLFLLHFPPFSLHLFNFFFPRWHRLIFFPSPRGGGGIFQYIDPCGSINCHSLSHLMQRNIQLADCSTVVCLIGSTCKIFKLFTVLGWVLCVGMRPTFRIFEVIKILSGHSSAAMGWSLSKTSRFPDFFFLFAGKLHFAGHWSSQAMKRSCFGLSGSQSC